jgi:plasmid maintenance system antidote protein VapI
MAEISNIHPREILKEEFLIPLGITAYKLSKDILNTTNTNESNY